MIWNINIKYKYWSPNICNKRFTCICYYMHIVYIKSEVHNLRSPVDNNVNNV